MSTTKNEEKLVKEELKKLKESGNKIERLDQVPDELAIYDPETGSRKLVKNPEADKMREEIKEKLKKNPENLKQQQQQEQQQKQQPQPTTKQQQQSLETREIKNQRRT